MISLVQIRLVLLETICFNLKIFDIIKLLKVYTSIKTLTEKVNKSSLLIPRTEGFN